MIDFEEKEEKQKIAKIYGNKYSWWALDTINYYNNKEEDVIKKIKQLYPEKELYVIFYDKNNKQIGTYEKSAITDTMQYDEIYTTTKNNNSEQLNLENHYNSQYSKDLFDNNNIEEKQFQQSTDIYKKTEKLSFYKKQKDKNCCEIVCNCNKAGKYFDISIQIYFDKTTQQIKDFYLGMKKKYKDQNQQYDNQFYYDKYTINSDDTISYDGSYTKENNEFEEISNNYNINDLMPLRDNLCDYNDTLYSFISILQNSMLDKTTSHYQILVDVLTKIINTLEEKTTNINKEEDNKEIGFFLKKLKDGLNKEEYQRGLYRNNRQNDNEKEENNFNFHKAKKDLESIKKNDNIFCKVVNGINYLIDNIYKGFFYNIYQYMTYKPKEINNNTSKHELSCIKNNNHFKRKY